MLKCKGGPGHLNAEELTRLVTTWLAEGQKKNETATTAQSGSSSAPPMRL